MIFCGHDWIQCKDEIQLLAQELTVIHMEFGARVIGWKHDRCHGQSNGRDEGTFQVNRWIHFEGILGKSQRPNRIIHFLVILDGNRQCIIAAFLAISLIDHNWLFLFNFILPIPMYPKILWSDTPDSVHEFVGIIRLDIKLLHGHHLGRRSDYCLFFVCWHCMTTILKLVGRKHAADCRRLEQNLFCVGIELLLGSMLTTRTDTLAGRF